MFESYISRIKTERLNSRDIEKCPECAARLQPLVDQYKPIQHQTLAIEKFRDFIVTTRSCPRYKNISLKKNFF